MSSNRFDPKSATISFDPAGAFLPGGLSRDEWVAICPRFEAVRGGVREPMQLRENAAGSDGWNAVATIATIADRMLADYRTNRRSSELGRILAAAKRMREAVDRVVIVGSEENCSSARTLFETCCHPYHNEQGRGDRGGRPRIYFAPSGFDNDALQGLLDLLPHERKSATVDERWGMIVIDSGGEPRAVRNAEDAEDAEKRGRAVVLRVLLGALRRACGGDIATAARLIVPVVAKSASVGDLIEAVNCSEAFDLPSGAGGRGAVFSPAGLLPTSVMGLDIVRLLEGAAAMSERFRTAPIGDNPPLDFAAVCELMKQHAGTSARRLVGRGRGGEAVARWCDGLFRNSDLRSEISDFKSASSNLQINLIVESVRRDRIVIEAVDSIDDSLGQLVGKTLPELDAAAFDSARTATAAAGRPAVEIHLPALDESALGQLFQMLILATVLEFRLQP
jgi:glucose-6-phosphate isomerase